MSRAPQPQGPDTGLIYALSHPWQWALAASWRGLSRHYRGLGVWTAAVGVSLWLGSAWFGVVLLLVAGAAWMYFRRTAPGKGWWDHATLAPALVDAGILSRAKPDKKGNTLPTLSYRGKPQHSDHGTTVVVGLPQAVELADVVNRRGKLAAALRVPVNRLEVGQDPDDPANVVSIHVRNPGKLAVSAPTVADAERTFWRDPVRVGHGTRGEPETLPMFEANTLVAGKPGSGKTVLTRIPLAHFLLDPTTSVYLLDGKGSIDDYGACRSLCKRFIFGTDENAVEDTIAMLTEVLDIVRARNLQGGEHDGFLLLLEEYQDIRAAATKAQLDRLDTTMSRIIRMQRAVGGHALFSTQRPSADDLPTSTRNLITNRVALMLPNPEDAKLVLGRTPAIGLPSRRGEALLNDGQSIRAVTLDRLTDEAWRAVCKRAAVLRGGVVGEGRPALTVVPSQPAALDPLLEAVLGVLANADPRGITASELHARLPEWTRPVCPSAQTLGVTLRRHPGLLEQVHIRSTRVWRMTASGRANLSAGAM